MDKSIVAFNNNIESIVSKLIELGFAPNVPEYYGDTKEDIEARRQAEIERLRTIDPTVEQNRDNLYFNVWERESEYDDVFVHFDMYARNQMGSTTSAREIKMLITDERHSFGSKEFRKINTPNVKNLLTRIQAVEEKLTKQREAVVAAREQREKQYPILKKEIENVFGNDADVEEVVQSFKITYKGAVIRLNFNAKQSTVTVKVFDAEKVVTLAKARQIIDFIND